MNKKCLEFLNFASIKEFKKSHKCICEFFEKRQGYISQHMHTGQRWLSYIISNRELEHKVIMKNRVTAEDSVFLVKYKKFPLDEKYYIFSLNDITTIESESKIDKLTQIYNRTHFDEILEYEINMKLRYPDRQISIIFFDVDHFKVFNDTYGHDMGDRVLKELSSLVNSLLRGSDTFARWGGEEFVILLPNSSLSQSCLTANRIKKSITKLNVSGLSVTCSFGVAQLRLNEDAKEVLKRADQNLYTAKERGRNRVVCH
jgi:diguanylate cyclase (GGDEF)-like protein